MSTQASPTLPPDLTWDSYTRQTCGDRRQYRAESTAAGIANYLSRKHSLHSFKHYFCVNCGTYHVRRDDEGGAE